MRGIVVTNEFEAKGSNINIISSSIDSVKLRQYLLFWDRIDFPCNNLLYCGLNEEEEYLEKVGILQRTSLNEFPNGLINMEKLMLDMQMNAFETNNCKENEIWSLAQPNKNIVLPDNKSVRSATLHLDIFNSIPIPHNSVDLDKILNFKEKRYAELLEYRYCMDNVYLELLKSPDIDISKSIAIRNMQKKIIELNKIMDESLIKRILGSIKVELDITSLVVYGISGLITGSAIGFPEVGTLLGLAGSAIKVSSDVSLKPRKIPENLKDYAYLYYAQKEL